MPSTAPPTRAQLLGRIIKEVRRKTILDTFDAAWRTFSAQAKPEHLLSDAHDLSAEESAQILVEIARECGEPIEAITRAWNRTADELCNGGATPYELSLCYVRALFDSLTKNGEETAHLKGSVA